MSNKDVVKLYANILILILLAVLMIATNWFIL